MMVSGFAFPALLAEYKASSVVLLDRVAVSLPTTALFASRKFIVPC